MHYSTTTLSSAAAARCLAAVGLLLVSAAANAQFSNADEERREREQRQDQERLDGDRVQQPAFGSPSMRNSAELQNRAFLNADREAFNRGNQANGLPGSKGMPNPNGSGMPSGSKATGVFAKPGVNAGMPNTAAANNRLGVGLKHPGQSRFAMPSGRKSTKPGVGKPPAGVQAAGKLPKGALASPSTGLFRSDIDSEQGGAASRASLSGLGGNQAMAGGGAKNNKDAKNNSKNPKNAKPAKSGKNAKNSKTSKDSKNAKGKPKSTSKSAKAKDSSTPYYKDRPAWKQSMTAQFLYLQGVIDAGKAEPGQKEAYLSLKKEIKGWYKENNKKSNKKKIGNCHASDPNCDMSTEEQRNAKLRKDLMKKGKFPGEGDRMRPVNEGDGNDDSQGTVLGSDGYSRPTQSSKDGEHAGGRIVTRLEQQGNPGGERD